MWSYSLGLIVLTQMVVIPEETAAAVNEGQF